MKPRCACIGGFLLLLTALVSCAGTRRTETGSSIQAGLQHLIEYLRRGGFVLGLGAPPPVQAGILFSPVSLGT